MSDLTDKLYCEFIESLNMAIPDEDCTDYKEQDDYKAIEFCQSKIQSLEKKLTERDEQFQKLRDGYVSRDARVVELEKKLEVAREQNQKMLACMDEINSIVNDDKILNITGVDRDEALNIARSLALKAGRTALLCKARVELAIAQIASEDKQ